MKYYKFNGSLFCSNNGIQSSKILMEFSLYWKEHGSLHERNASNPLVQINGIQIYAGKDCVLLLKITCLK
mgnify:CR=1 FL=1